MFKIEVTVWPWGKEPHGSDDHVVELACYNDGTGTRDRASYKCMEMEHGEEPRDTYDRYERAGEGPDVTILGYPRNHAQGHLAGLASLILDRYSRGDDTPVLCWEVEGEAT